MHPTLSSILRRKNLKAQLNRRDAFARRLLHTPRTAAASLLLPALCFVVALASFNAAQQRAQPPRQPEQPDMTIDAATRTQVIEGALKNLNEAYVYPETAKRMEEAIRERVAKKEYEGVTSAKALAQMLTEHLQAVSRDKHLRVNYRAEALAAGETLPGAARIVRRVPEGDGGATPADGASGRRIIREPGGVETPADGATPRVVRRNPNDLTGNMGLEKVETLEGNLGLLEFSYFDSSAAAGKKISDAMNTLADTDALIIDLRRCRGGASNAITLLMSYFFDKSIHLSDAYDRVMNGTNEFWSLAEVPGRRYGTKKDVYILTSRFTFSAAEDISYTLKNLQRASIVGETTGGGAHPVRGMRLNEHFFVMVPFARYISPITKTNWEGTGVEPDVKVPASHALKVAQLAALKKLSAQKTTDAKASAALKSLIETLQKEVDALKQESSKS
jgi:retinol-binding protein 3